MTLTHEKQQVHELIELLAPSQVRAVRGLLQTMLDPVPRAISRAAVDGEPLAAEDAHALEEAREWLKHNGPIPHAQVLAEIGVTQEEVEDHTEAAVQGVAPSDEALTVDLADGRTITVPLAWFPRLAHGTAAERDNRRLIGGGSGIHWPDLDEDISVESLLAGRRSGETQASLRRWLQARKTGR